VNSAFTFAIRPPGESFWVLAMGRGPGSDPHRLQSACSIERVSCSVLIIAALLVVWFPPGACAFAPVPLQHFGPQQLSKRATCSSEWARRPIPSAPCAKHGGTWRLPELSCQNSDEPFGGGGGESGENQNESLSSNQDRRGAQGASARDRDGRQGSGGGLDSDKSSAGNRRQGSGGQGSAGAGGIVSTRTSTRGYSFSVNRAAPAHAASMHTVHPPPLPLPTILAPPSALFPCRRSSMPWAPTMRTAARALQAGARRTTPKAPVRAGTLPALSRAGGCSAPRSTACPRLTAARRRSGRRGRAPLCEPRQARRGGARRRAGATGQCRVGRRSGRPVVGRGRGGETRDQPPVLPVDAGEARWRCARGPATPRAEAQRVGLGCELDGGMGGGRRALRCAPLPRARSALLAAGRCGPGPAACTRREAAGRGWAGRGRRGRDRGGA
jgi:hypothetical protein